MIARAHITGLILAGGRARRMQGGGLDIDKGLLGLDGAPLVAHAQRYLAPQVGALLVSANRHLEDYADYGRVLADDPALGSDLGPLSGVASALAASSSPWLAVMPVDVLNLPADMVARLARAADEAGALIAYASTADPAWEVASSPDRPGSAEGGGRAHPLCMVVHASLARSLRDYLEAGDRKVQLWQKRHAAVPVFFDPGPDAFFNINTPEDLRRAAQASQRARS
ncbi:molybdenum cofactor guanylyltransferase MobA [Pollutimonas sp. M17]|uniref:molybdenum cofactor guanylyltransferase MobA n=1 Tax=Pollutimonas sp. M17 TaxID=2962065 RepID=UPI0021F4BFEA|nr:molybdenum cofactor guanylyltransferase MobA [Pollutimonas sp. M17]UYO92997.1 molybdenum cofactor guanylyltransferase [Pollutimonas sp. M17]